MAFSITDLVTSDTGDYINTEGNDRIFIRFTNDPFTATLSFIGTLRVPNYQQLLTSTLSFVGSITRATSRSFTAACSPAGSLVSRMAETFFVSLSSSLFLRSGLFFNWADLWASLYVSVKQIIDGALQSITGNIVIYKRAGIFFTDEVEISTSPSLLSIPASTTGEIFIKNLDTTEIVEIDSSSSFNEFPQKIYPKMGVYLAPANSVPIYARSTGTSSIQIIMGG